MKTTSLYHSSTTPSKDTLQAALYPLHRIKYLRICHSAAIVQDGQYFPAARCPAPFKTKPIIQQSSRYLRFRSPSPCTYRCELKACLLEYDQASTNYKEAFALFDKRGNGRVALQSLGDLLRACGQNPTLAEIHDLEKSVGGDCTWRTP